MVSCDRLCGFLIYSVTFRWTIKHRISNIFHILTARNYASLEINKYLQGNTLRRYARWGYIWSDFIHVPGPTVGILTKNSSDKSHATQMTRVPTSFRLNTDRGITKRIICAKGICSWVLIDTLNRYPQSIPLINILFNTWLTSWSVLNQHPNWYSVDTQSTVDQQSTDSRSSATWLICIDRKLMDCWPTVDRDVDGASMEYQPRCRWSVG